MKKGIVIRETEKQILKNIWNSWKTIFYAFSMLFVGYINIPVEYLIIPNELFKFIGIVICFFMAVYSGNKVYKIERSKIEKCHVDKKARCVTKDKKCRDCVTAHIYFLRKG